MSMLDEPERSRFQSGANLSDFREFFKRFGGSVRTKHVHRWWPFSRKGVGYWLPFTSGIPKGFIRLCPWEVEYLFVLARRAKVGILEIGRFNGGSAFVMACANPKVPIYSIDLQPQNDDLLRELFRRHGVGKKVDIIVGDSQHTRYEQIKAIDLLFIDGDHSYEGCTADIVNWFDLVVPGGYVLFHDSYLGNGVQDALLDFIDKRDDVEIVLSPIIGRQFWRYQTGSLACLRKRRA